MHNITLIIIMASVTTLTRFLPFIIFNKKVPSFVLYLGKVLPTAIIGMLVVYCLKDISFTTYPFAIKEIIASIIVILLQLKTRNSLISIICGTCIYMVLQS